MICINLGIWKCWCFFNYFLLCNFWKAYRLLKVVVALSVIAVGMYSCYFTSTRNHLYCFPWAGYFPWVWTQVFHWVLFLLKWFFVVFVVSIFLLFWGDCDVVSIIFGIFVIAFVISTAAGLFLGWSVSLWSDAGWAGVNIVFWGLGTSMVVVSGLCMGRGEGGIN